jgi:hypothetical protein
MDMLKSCVGILASLLVAVSGPLYLCKEQYRLRRYGSLHNDEIAQRRVS